MASGGGEKILKTHEEWSEKFGKIDDRFANFYNERVLSDVTFIVGPDKEIVRGHKFVLISCSWEFFVVLCLLKLDNEMLDIPDMQYNSFVCFLEFCYRGKVDLDGKDVWDVLKLAYRFNVKQLIESCDDFLNKNLKIGTCIDYYTKDTFLHAHSEIRKRIFEKIESEFATVTNNNKSLLKSFLDIPAQKLHNIAKSENLTCNEMDVFRNLMKWAEHACKKVRFDCLPKNLRKILGDIFYEIRFPIMKPEQILEIQTNYPELLSPREISAISKYILNEDDHCNGFKFKLRVGREYSVICYTVRGSRKLTNKLSIAFMSERPRKFVGFCFCDFHWSGSIRLFESHFCKLNKKLVNWTLTRFESVSRINPSFLISQYTIRFQEKQDIIPQQWYELELIFGKNYRLVTYTSTLNSYDEFNKIHLKKDLNNFIPELIFQN